MYVERCLLGNQTNDLDRRNNKKFIAGIAILYSLRGFLYLISIVRMHEGFVKSEYEENKAVGLGDCR